MAKQVSWSEYTQFNKTNVDKVTDKEGIYKLGFENSKDTNKIIVFYVGQADNLKKRLTDHLDDKENSCIKNNVKDKNCYFKYALVPQQSDRDCMESFLYNHYGKPDCNKQKPSSDPCEINPN